MRTQHLLLVACTSLAACSGSSSFQGAPLNAYYRASRVAPTGSYSAPSSPGGAASTAVAESAPPPQAAQVDPSLRPGLATSWGENVRSRVRMSSFERASDTPFDTAALWYNDARLLGMQAERAARQPSMLVLGRANAGVRVSLRDEQGLVLPGVHSNGRTFVLGTSGQRYTIVLENRTNASYEAVVTVDGLDVISGQAGSYANRGYVIRPYGRLEISGFRQSLDRVAAFRFGSVGESYAADRGDARNVGVIGFALFAERGAMLDLERNEVELREEASPFPSGFAPPPRRW